MSDVAIRVTNLGKKFRIGSREPYLRFSELPRRLISTVAGRLRSTATNVDSSNLWALKDVSFEVKRGEVVGIIGRNGAGKSTLLKILSRITKPTEGQVQLRGRVGSLLEVGTGFHPELTGRENIYLNGTILGMRKREIDRKFDEIVAFSEIERFLDTPVKHYSSGMYMRLAFAVAAHLEPEILIVNEVLAVGDTQFQKKCLGKMGEVARGGRTVLFVSHNLGAVSRLCQTTLLLTSGAKQYFGATPEAIHLYVLDSEQSQSQHVTRGILLRVSLNDGEGAIDIWRPNACLVMDVWIESQMASFQPAVDLAFYSDGGARVFAVQSDRSPSMEHLAPGRRFRFRFKMVNPCITCGRLYIDIGLRHQYRPEYIAWWQHVRTVAAVAQGGNTASVSETLLSIPVDVERIGEPS